ncbi:MAG: prepilin-type N-terminal cleavage/methylation domain-containing protein [Sulfurovum sp.]|nr:prepilin-type N-terminal cleavage/methylation domain-containing protein [Sulfurovum sp.]
MSSSKRYPKRKGFSLIELLIVILIISIVYFLGFDGIEIGKQRPKPLTPLNLKSNIVSSESFAGQATLLCINKCLTCYLRSNISSGFEEYSSATDLRDIKAYTLDKDNTLMPMEYERYQDKKICLIMDFYSNGSSTQIILEKDDKSYFLPAFFGEPKVFDSAEEAQDYWLRNSTAVSDSGDFY